MVKRQGEGAKEEARVKAEVKVEVEHHNAAVSKAIVDYEMKVQEANWELSNRQKAAEAKLFLMEGVGRGGLLCETEGGRGRALREEEGGRGIGCYGSGTERVRLGHAWRVGWELCRAA